MSRAARRAGRPAEPKNWRVAKSIFVADDLATAKRYATVAGGSLLRLLQVAGDEARAERPGNLFKADQNAPDSTVTPQSVVDQVVIWGTPEKVVDDLLAFREEIGDFGTLLYASHDWADKRLGRRSMELMAEKVMPAINSHTAASEAA